MEFKDYFKSLDRKEQERYAKRAGTSLTYIRCHLLAARKTPRAERMKRLTDATEGRVSWDEMLEHFYSRQRA